MVRKLLLKSARDIRVSKAQTIALIVIVAMGIASFLALLGAYRDLSTSYNHTYDRLDFADASFSLQRGDAAAVGAVKSIDGVKAASGRLIVDTAYALEGDEAGDALIRSRMISMPADHRPDVNNILIQEGDYFQEGHPRQVIVETGFAGKHDIHPGDTVTPIIDGKAVELQVVGVAASPEYLIVSPGKQDIIPSPRTFAVLFLPEGELQELTDNKGVINDIAVTFEPGADGEAVTTAIAAQLESYGVKDITPREDQPSYAALKLDLDGYREIAVLMPGLILLVAAASVYVMLSRHVRAQQQQIGVMKAIGYSNRAIIFHYLAVALFIGLLGSILGSIGGQPLERWITGFYAGELGIPLVQTSFYPDLVLAGVLLSLAVTALAGLGPALGVTRMAPAQAMHFDPASARVKGRATLIERVLPVPFWMKISLRNVFRVKRRSLSTGLGIIFAFMLLLMSWGMIDSMSYMVDNNFNEVERWDMTAGFNTPQIRETLDEISSWQGVTRVEPFLQMPVVVSSRGVQKNILLNALSRDQTLHKLALESDISQRQALADGKLVLTTAIAESLGVKAGDQVDLTTPRGSRTLEISSLTNELMGSVGYISLEQANKWTGVPEALFNGVYLTADEAAMPTVRADLNHLPDVAGVQLKTGIKSDWQSMLGIFYAFMGVIMAFAVAMSFALLFNTMTVNVLEQQRELATMRSVGASHRRIGALMTTENIILWALTLIPGLLMGYWVALQMGKAFESDLFTFDIIINPSSYAITAVGILLTMVLASLPAIRRINRLNLAEATKNLD